MAEPSAAAREWLAAAGPEGVLPELRTGLFRGDAALRATINECRGAGWAELRPPSDPAPGSPWRITEAGRAAVGRPA